MLLKYMSSIIPNVAYPSTNSNTNSLVPPLWRKPGPIKHYRKELQPTYYSKSRRASADRINVPGGSIYKNSYTCSDDSSVNIIKTDVIQGFTPCVGPLYLQTCNAEFNQNVYNTSQSYLQSRCITQEQNNGTVRGMFKTFTPELYESPHCSKTSGHIIYKPNNKKYGTQGGVSSSSRMARMKYANQTRNGAYFMNARGAKQMNKGVYTSSGINTNIRNKSEQCTSSITNKNRGKKIAHNNCVINNTTQLDLPNLDIYELYIGINNLCKYNT